MYEDLVVLSADWSSNPKTRCVYRADCARAVVCREDEPRKGWTLRSLLDRARAVAESEYSVLVTIDVVLGVPISYLNMARKVAMWRNVSTFIDWLAACPEGEFWLEVTKPQNWSPARPFFGIPPEGGRGSLSAFSENATCDLKRKIDSKTGAKSPFLVCGIPGTVGAGSRSVWKELKPLLTRDRDFGIWPFDGDGTIQGLFQTRSIIIAEMYPALCYGIALSDRMPSLMMRLAKRHKIERRRAVETLSRAEWVTEMNATISGQNEAIGKGDNDDDNFDAMMTAAAVLRVVRQKPGMLAQCDPEIRAVEGGMLLAAAIDWNRRRKGQSVPRVGVRNSNVMGPQGGALAQFRCPIDGCGKVFNGSRGGWDAHVGSRRMHPNWHPDVTNAADRRECFKDEFPEFFD